MRTSTIRRRLAYVVTALAVIAGTGVAASSPALAATSAVYVVHGIPNTPVDVYVNGAKTLDNFQPGDVAGPLELEEGSYDLALTRPGEALSNAILTVDDAAVPGGANISVVAHLNTAGTPAITPFVNDVSRIEAGNARLIVRHTAAAPAVDVRADGTAVFQNLTNPNEAKADIAAATVSADVVLAGTSTVAIGPAELNLREGTATIVYAIGSAEDGTLSLVTQVITGLNSAPANVPSGDGGLSGAGGLNGWWYALIAIGVLLIIGAGTRLVTGRRANAR